jgi:general secretion pathway protein N
VDRPSTAERLPLPRAALVGTIVIAASVAIAVVVATAPANWLARYVAMRTGDVVLLADAEGTIWSGSAVVAVGPADGADVRHPAGERLALPGRVIWTLEMSRPLAPVLHLTHDGVLLQPLTVRPAGGGFVLGTGAASLPASLLRLVGAPLNSLLPEGHCELRWNDLSVDARGATTGEGTLRVAGFALAVSPVRPLGDYLVNWSSDARGLTWRLATERGPLALEGNGSVIGARAEVHVVAKAAPGASTAVVAQLGPLLDAIGRRGPDEAVIDSDAS